MDQNQEKQIQNNERSVSIPLTGGSSFSNIYNKSYRLSAAVFMIANIIEGDENLKTQIKRLALSLVSTSIQLKDRTFSDAQKIVGEIEKVSLELMSLLNIASVAGFITDMNASILKEEFESFLEALKYFSAAFETNRSVSVKNIFENEDLEVVKKEISHSFKGDNIVEKNEEKSDKVEKSFDQNRQTGNGSKSFKRKDVRRETIYEFIKGHNNSNIKDIVPNIIGCSEKTIQRELIELIKEGKIRKIGERRWSRYSIV